MNLKLKNLSKRMETIFQVTSPWKGLIPNWLELKLFLNLCYTPYRFHLNFALSPGSGSPAERPSDAAAVAESPGAEEIGQTPIKSPAPKKARSDLAPEAEFTQVLPHRLDSQGTLVLGEGSPSSTNRNLKDVFDSLAEATPAKTDIASWLLSPPYG